ncbi:protein kinase family protein [Streptomyces sp. NPDC058676]|uniref:protein kinase family protein n=1 Tax=unclassified Streptomyces TaxID=2593676 RepID=UPI00364A4038
MPRNGRLARHSDISTTLDLLSDRELARLLASGTANGSGIGGRSTLIQVDGVPVFVKRVRLTDAERLPENIRSTANLFGLPTYFHYGIGSVPSPGFGAWRELALHTMTTNWVLSERFTGFPLLHHWRVLPDERRPLPEELADVERAVAYWGGSPQVRERIEGRRTATADLALFLEYLPTTLHDWLHTKMETGDPEAACLLVERGLEEAVSFLHEHGLLHFDAHFKNILTDGRRLYLTDHGLALSSRFRLAPRERAFFDAHRHYDRAYTRMYLVIWLVTELYGYRGEEREAFVRACAEGERPRGIPETAAALITRHAGQALVMTEFSRRFQEESRLTPCPPPYGGMTGRQVTA